jgi:hypothetical protein
MLSPKKFGLCRMSSPGMGTEGFKIEIGHVTHDSIGNFIKMKKYALGKQKGENKPSKLENRIEAPTSVATRLNVGCHNVGDFFDKRSVIIVWKKDIFCVIFSCFFFNSLTLCPKKNDSMSADLMSFF